MRYTILFLPVTFLITMFSAVGQQVADTSFKAKVGARRIRRAAGPWC